MFYIYLDEYWSDWEKSLKNKFDTIIGDILISSA